MLRMALKKLSGHLPSPHTQPSYWHLTPQGPGRLCQMMFQVSRAPGEPWSESHGIWLWPASWKGMPTLATSHCPGRAHHRGARQKHIQHSVPNANPGLLLLAEHGPHRKGLSTVVYTVCPHMEVSPGFSRLLHTGKTDTPRENSSSKPIWPSTTLSPALSPEPGGWGGPRDACRVKLPAGRRCKVDHQEVGRHGDVAQQLLLLQRNQLCLPAHPGRLTICGLDYMALQSCGTQTCTQVRYSHKVKINI